YQSLPMGTLRDRSDRMLLSSCRLVEVG
ncbi:hypothetical protein D049_4701B, partial [Vibrio parahaemolyticus VPTS-2010]